jgi:hypothetical protein
VADVIKRLGKQRFIARGRLRLTAANNLSIANDWAITASACVTASRSTSGWLLNTITGTCAVAGAALSSASTESPDCSGSTRSSSTRAKRSR